ncbi:hypothetical protein [Aureibacillus halotolerans]|uniref:Uncharacterized protein n=1 Tax=Aureibacillus halotolerans TaxID=1508390 RepID=A0A4R6U1M9_9BACI|nr:hypothetical protein [Aureibacillus halotolerans]TDQ39202.1 hypothetical protein EV213_108154 [Aureibacillus halotolerans]
MNDLQDVMDAVLISLGASDWNAVADQLDKQEIEQVQEYVALLQAMLAQKKATFAEVALKGYLPVAPIVPQNEEEKTVIEIKISATPELIDALSKFTAALQQDAPETKKESKTNKKTEPKEEKQEEEKAEPAEEKEEAKSKYSLDTITSKTREFIQGNSENKKLLKGFLDEKDVPKVSALEVADYDEYMAFIEEHSA